MISLVNVTKFGHIYCRNPSWKTSFFVQWILRQRMLWASMVKVRWIVMELICQSFLVNLSWPSARFKRVVQEVKKQNRFGASRIPCSINRRESKISFVVFQTGEINSRVKNRSNKIPVVVRRSNKILRVSNNKNSKAQYQIF